MMVCPKCGVPLNDGSAVCKNCGYSLQGNSQGPNFSNQQQVMYDIYDHTGEFTMEDISDNKVMAMLPYLMGVFGIIVALLASRESKYTYFHVRQAVKIMVVKILTIIISGIFAITIIIPIAGGLFLIFLWILNIIAFFQVCSGKAKEPVAVRGMGFLK